MDNSQKYTLVKTIICSYSSYGDNFLIAKINIFGGQIYFMYFYYYFISMDTRRDDTFTTERKKR